MCGFQRALELPAIDHVERAAEAETFCSDAACAQRVEAMRAPAQKGTLFEFAARLQAFHQPHVHVFSAALRRAGDDLGDALHGFTSRGVLSLCSNRPW